MNIGFNASDCVINADKEFARQSELWFSVLLKTGVLIFYQDMDLIMILLKLTRIICVIK